MKLKDCGIMWIDESEMYVADIDLFATPEDFLKAVLTHIKHLLDTNDDGECGWCKMPNYDEYLPFVTTAYMRHAVNVIANEPEWWMEYEAGKGRRKVWCIDFSIRGFSR